MNRHDLIFLYKIFKNNDLSRIHCVVINQCTKIDIPIIISPSNFTIYSYKGSGLSSSRNLAIKKSFGDICVIADDDIEYVENINEIISDVFENNKIDVATFCFNNSLAQKKYHTIRKSHNKISILKVSSIEIAFKRSAVLSKNISFDESFGLGTANTSGEENIFLFDCLKNKLKTYFFPLFISSHNEISTGLTLTNDLLYQKIFLFKRLFPSYKIWVALYIIFHVKKKGILSMKNAIINLYMFKNHCRGVYEGK